MRSETKRYENFRAKAWSGLTRYVKEKYRISTIITQEFNMYIIHSFEIASKYPNVIAVVSSCTYIAIILTFTCACLLLKVRGVLILDSRFCIYY